MFLTQVHATVVIVVSTFSAHHACMRLQRVFRACIFALQVERKLLSPQHFFLSSGLDDSGRDPKTENGHKYLCILWKSRTPPPPTHTPLLLSCRPSRAGVRVGAVRKLAPTLAVTRNAFALPFHSFFTLRSQSRKKQTRQS